MFTLLSMYQSNNRGKIISTLVGILSIFNIRIHLLVEYYVSGFYESIIIIDTLVCVIILLILRSLSDKLSRLCLIYGISVLLNYYMLYFQIGTFMYDHYELINIVLFEILILILFDNSTLKPKVIGLLDMMTEKFKVIKSNGQTMWYIYLYNRYYKGE